MDDHRVSVTVFGNGPMKVSNARSVRFCGETIETEGDIFLCRCGKSTNAPFCDGTHKSAGFTDDNPERPTKEIVVWEGETLRTFFNPNTCMHVFTCKPLKELRAAELEGNPDAAAEIMRVIGGCPSGALSYETKTAMEEPTVAPEVDVDIMEGGEIRVQTTFEINHSLHERQSDDRATLCRCGLSKSKPWCDGRHRGRKNFR